MVFSKVGPIQSIEWGQIRVSKSRPLDTWNPSCIAEGANEDIAFSFNFGPSVRLVKIESDRPCKAQYFTHLQKWEAIGRLWRYFNNYTPNRVGRSLELSWPVEADYLVLGNKRNQQEVQER